MPELTLRRTIPPQGGFLSVNSDISFEFSSEIFVDSSDIVIYDLSSGEVFERINVETDTNQYTISNSTFVLNISNTLDYNKTYSIVFESGAIKDINNTQFTGLSDQGTLVFRTFEFDCLRKTNRLEIIDASFLSINTASYSSSRKFGLYDGIYLLENISFDTPITILNQSEISISVIDDSPIIIKVTGGNISQNENGDYYEFTDNLNESITIANGNFRFMRGRTYRFADHGISNSHPFKVFANNTESSAISGSQNGDNYIDIRIDEDHPTTNGELFYQCGNHSNMKVNMGILHREFVNDPVVPDGSYDFYYGSINISISGEFLPTSIYTFNNGFMGMDNKITYQDVCEIETGVVKISTNENYRIFETNNWPNFDGFDTYVQSFQYGGNNIPKERTKTEIPGSYNADVSKW